MSCMQAAVQLIDTNIAVYGTPVIFVIIFLEALGIPLPGESALVAISVLATRGDINLSHALFAVFCGAVLGDSTGYLIGYFGGRPLLLRFGYLFKLSHERIVKIEALFRSKGTWIVITARFFPIFRQLNGFIAGSVHMPWSRFLFANLLGAAAWVIAWGIIPYVMADHFKPLLAH